MCVTNAVQGLTRENQATMRADQTHQCLFLPHALTIGGEAQLWQLQGFKWGA